MRPDAGGGEGGAVDGDLVEGAAEDAVVVGGAADEERLGVGGQLDVGVRRGPEDAVDVHLGGRLVVGGDDVVPVRVDGGRIGGHRGVSVAEEGDGLVGRVDPERVVLRADGAVSGLGEDVLPGAGLGALDPGLDGDPAGRVQGAGVGHADDVVDAVEGGGRVRIGRERAGLPERDPVLVGAVVRARLVVGHRPRGLAQPPVRRRAVGEDLVAVARADRERVRCAHAEVAVRVGLLGSDRVRAVRQRVTLTDQLPAASRRRVGLERRAGRRQAQIDVDRDGGKVARGRSCAARVERRVVLARAAVGRGRERHGRRRDVGRGDGERRRRAQPEVPGAIRLLCARGVDAVGERRRGVHRPRARARARRPRLDELPAGRVPAVDPQSHGVRSPAAVPACPAKVGVGPTTLPLAGGGERDRGRCRVDGGGGGVVRLDAGGGEGGGVDGDLVEGAAEDAVVVGGAADEERLGVGGQLDVGVRRGLQDAVDVHLGGRLVVGGDDVVPVRVDRRRSGAYGGGAVAEVRDRLVGGVEPERIVLGGVGAVSGLGEDVLPGAALGALDPGLDGDPGGRVQGARVGHADDVVDAVEGNGRVRIGGERARLAERDPVLVGAVVRARSRRPPPSPEASPSRQYAAGPVREHIAPIRRRRRRRARHAEGGGAAGAGVVGGVVVARLGRCRCRRRAGWRWWCRRLAPLGVAVRVWTGLPVAVAPA